MPPHDPVQDLQQTMGEGGEKAFDIVPVILKRVIERRLWAERCDRNGKPFANFEAFVTHILWQGLESSIDDLRIFCRKHPDVLKLVNGEVQPVAAHGGDRTSAAKQGDNITLKQSRGTNPTYALKRLKRDRPDLAARVVAGELTPNAAAIEAGFRKRAFSVPDDPEAAADALVRRFGKGGIASLIAALNVRLNTKP